MREVLLDARRAATAAGVKALHHESPADRRFLYVKPVDIELVVVFGVGDSRLQHLPDVLRDAPRREGQFGESSRRVLAADYLGDKVELARAGAQGAQKRRRLVVLKPAFRLGLPHQALPLGPPGPFIAGMAAECASRRELAKFVADHVLGHQHRDEFVAVVDTKGQSDELREDGRPTRPGPDHLVASRSARLLGLLQEIAVDERAFPYRACHALSPLSGLLTAADDQPVRCLVLPRLLALGRLAPRGHRMAAARRLAFAAAMRMVDRVHRDTAHRGLAAEPAVPPGLADHDILVVGVRDRTDRRAAFGADHAHLARGHAEEGIALLAADELNVGAGRAGDLTALA